MSKNLSDKYYQENKERLQKKACEGYQNLSDDEKQKLPEYRKKYYRIGKKMVHSLQFDIQIRRFKRFKRFELCTLQETY